MDYKLVAIDLDDTLLADDLKISSQTIDAIQKSVEKGVTITFATGRMYQSAVRYAREVELNVPIITYQGAFVKNVIDKEVIYERLLPLNISIDIITELKKKGKSIQIYLDDELYTDKDNHYAEEYSRISQVKYYVVDDLIEQIKKSNNLPMKILIVDDPVEIKQLLNELTATYGEEINLTISKPKFLEISHKEATKGQAIKYLANKLGISLEQVIAIGDSYNDIDMIELAGLGVAMGNAHPEVKEIANYITKTNNDHGVAEVLNKFILNTYN